jgi:hypothetical protein
MQTTRNIPSRDQNPLPGMMRRIGTADSNATNQSALGGLFPARMMVWDPRPCSPARCICSCRGHVQTRGSKLAGSGGSLGYFDWNIFFFFFPFEGIGIYSFLCYYKVFVSPSNKTPKAYQLHFETPILKFTPFLLYAHVWAT